MNLIKLLDIANPKKIKDTLNLLITTYDGFDDAIRNIAKAAQKDASDALNNSETALSTVNTANANASAAKQTSEEALTMIEAADQRSEEATQTAETALDNANTATQTAELAMNLATQAKSTVDQAISTGVFGTFVHNPAGISLLHAYLTNDINQEDTAENTYVATPTLVKNALEAYLPLAGGQLTGALRIAKGTGNGIQDYDGNPMLYIDNYDDLYIRNDSGTEIHLGMHGEHIQIGGHKVLSDTNVVGHSFTFNDKSVAVTSDIPKTLNNKTLVANGNTIIYGTDIALTSDNTSNVTDAINGKADTSAIPTALSQLSEDTTHRIVTDTEKSTWNAKSDFDGDYNSLINQPTIPTNSDFTLAGLKEKSYNSLTDKPDISGKANLSGGNTFSGTQTFNNGITLSNDTAITNASGNNVITTQTGGHTIIGDPNGIINIQGSTTRPLYTKKDSGSEQLALYTDTKDKLPLTGGALTGLVTTTSSFNILNNTGSTRLGSIGAFSNNYVGIDTTTSIVLGKNGYNKKWFLIIGDDGSLTFQQ